MFTKVVVSIAEEEELTSIVDSREIQCTRSTVKEWNSKGELYLVYVPTRPSNTLRPVISIAFGLFDRNVSLPNVFGHGLVVTAKGEDGDHLFYIGRVSPNWAQVMFTQGTFTKAKYLGPKFARALSEDLNRAADKLSGVVSGRVEAVEVGVVDLGNVKDVFPGMAWQNPIRADACGGGSGHLSDYRFVVIPTYTGPLLRWFRKLNLSAWRPSRDRSTYSAVPLAFEENLHMIRGDLPEFLASFSLRPRSAGGSPIVVVPVNFALDLFKKWYRMPCPDLELLKVGIGTTVQGPVLCNAKCSGYGYYALVVGVSRLPFGKVGPLDLGSQYAYVGLTVPDLSKLISDDLKAYFKEELNMWKSLEMSIKFGDIISRIYSEYKEKYGYAIAEFVYTWVPITDNEEEARQIAQEVADIGLKIYERARQLLVEIKLEWAINSLGDCLLGMANPYSDRDIEEQAKLVASCAVYKGEVNYYYKEED